MRISIRTTTAVAFAALAAWLILSIPDTAQAQAPAGAKGKGGGKGFAQDPRAQTRMYHFEDTNEDLPYSLYVSSKVKKDQKIPLVVTLHGLGAPQTIMMGKTAIDLAEEAGYILVAPWATTPAAGMVLPSAPDPAGARATALQMRPRVLRMGRPTQPRMQPLLLPMEPRKARASVLPRAKDLAASVVATSRPT